LYQAATGRVVSLLGVTVVNANPTLAPSASPAAPVSSSSLPPLADDSSKIGIGVGVGVGVPLLLGLGYLVANERKKQKEVEHKRRNQVLPLDEQDDAKNGNDEEQAQEPPFQTAEFEEKAVAPERLYRPVVVLHGVRTRARKILGKRNNVVPMPNVVVLPAIEPSIAAPSFQKLIQSDSGKEMALMMKKQSVLPPILKRGQKGSIQTGMHRHHTQRLTKEQIEEEEEEEEGRDAGEVGEEGEEEVDDDDDEEEEVEEEEENMISISREIRSKVRHVASAIQAKSIARRHHSNNKAITIEDYQEDEEEEEEEEEALEVRLTAESKRLEEMRRRQEEREVQELQDVLATPLRVDEEVTTRPPSPTIITSPSPSQVVEEVSNLDTLLDSFSERLMEKIVQRLTQRLNV